MGSQVKICYFQAPRGIHGDQVGPTKHSGAQIGLSVQETARKIAILIPR
jgi:hypothetical protein